MLDCKCNTMSTTTTSPLGGKPKRTAALKRMPAKNGCEGWKGRPLARSKNTKQSQQVVPFQNVFGGPHALDTAAEERYRQSQDSAGWVAGEIGEAPNQLLSEVRQPVGGPVMARRPGAVSLVEPRARTLDEKGVCNVSCCSWGKGRAGSGSGTGAVHRDGEEFPVNFPGCGKLGGH